jgi:hypothetical protein
MTDGRAVPPGMLCAGLDIGIKTQLENSPTTCWEVNKNQLFCKHSAYLPSFKLTSGSVIGIPGKYLAMISAVCLARVKLLTLKYLTLHGPNDSLTPFTISAKRLPVSSACSRPNSVKTCLESSSYGIKKQMRHVN